ncbi:hypothetical protein [Burkholderia ubonensis]|uniref:hypothetical protein n=1 Tax=Burkholderia ubonensis TaxID=101571 RepID=UPI0007526034|nr:hypothetical protein [Burkholderia ubonensis]KVZ57526.1 hypothetical protein WL19_03415 [Burkholderia ubonensis]
MDILKAILDKIASWFKSEGAVVEQDVAARISQLESFVQATAARLQAESIARQIADAALAAPINSVAEASPHPLKMQTSSDGKTYIAGIASPIFGDGWTLSKDNALALTYSTTEVNMNVNIAIQIALAIKAADPTLSAEAVQAATNAALAAAYPAPAAEAPAA